jgi:hypothetical protein
LYFQNFPVPFARQLYFSRIFPVLNEFFWIFQNATKSLGDDFSVPVEFCNTGGDSRAEQQLQQTIQQQALLKTERNWEKTEDRQQERSPPVLPGTRVNWATNWGQRAAKSGLRTPGKNLTRRIYRIQRYTNPTLGNAYEN